MMRTLHIVGSFKRRWAITNRAAYLTDHLRRDIVADIVEKASMPPDPCGYDIVHIHSSILLPVVLGRPAYLNHRCWGFEVISERTVPQLQRTARQTPLAKFCIVKNPRLAEAVAKYVSCRPEYIPNGVETELFFPPTLRVGWCGNKRNDSLEHKGVELIRQAVAALAERYQHIAAVEFVTDPGDCPRKILGHSEIAPWYRSLDVYVSASESEGCSNTILEALASGVQVVSTNTGIAPELAAECGLVIVARSRAEITSGLAKVLKGVIARRRLMVEKYSWRVIAKRYLEFYNRCVKEAAEDEMAVSQVGA